MKGIGIFSFFGFDLPIEERLQLIKETGFDAVSLWWGDEDRNNQPDMAREFGLNIDNIHVPFGNPDPNQLWLDGYEGDDYQKLIISCIEDCKRHDISTAVIHLTRFRYNVDVTELGIKRIEKIVNTAERNNIKLAFENLAYNEHLDKVFENFPSPYVGFCYDSGHENIVRYYTKNPEYDCLSLYSDKLFALHINDNYGDGDTHAIPFNGTIDWTNRMNTLKQCKDVYYFTLELTYDKEHEKCKIYNTMSAKEFLNLAYKESLKLLEW